MNSLTLQENFLDARDVFLFRRLALLLGLSTGEEMDGGLGREPEKMLEIVLILIYLSESIKISPEEKKVKYDYFKEK
jgi:hypothetical protein